MKRLVCKRILGYLFVLLSIVFSANASAADAPPFIKKAAKDCSVEIIKQYNDPGLVDHNFDYNHDVFHEVNPWYVAPYENAMDSRAWLDNARLIYSRLAAFNYATNPLKEMQNWELRWLGRDEKDRKDALKKLSEEIKNEEDFLDSCTKTHEAIMQKGVPKRAFLMRITKYLDEKFIKDLMQSGLNMGETDPRSRSSKRQDLISCGFTVCFKKLNHSMIVISEFNYPTSHYIYSGGNFYLGYIDYSKDIIREDVDEKTKRMATGFLSTVISGLSDINATDGEGKNLVAYALMNRDVEWTEIILKMLRDKGAIPRAWIDHPFDRIKNPVDLYNGNDRELYDWLATAPPPHTQKNKSQPKAKSKKRNN